MNTEPAASAKGAEPGGYIGNPAPAGAPPTQLLQIQESICEGSVIAAYLLKSSYKRGHDRGSTYIKS
jgi:hypothetical protein